MKRITFITLGLTAISFIACNTTVKEEKKEVPAPKTEKVVLETTTQFETQALEDCIDYSKTLNDLKLLQAAEAQRVADSIAAAELELKEALAKAEAAKRKRESTPEMLAKRAKEAELWFEENYASVVKAYNANFDGVRVKMNTEGTIYDVALFTNGEWKVDETLKSELQKVQVANNLAEGKAVAITVGNFQSDYRVAAN